jgi:hypothetical protein
MAAKRTARAEKAPARPRANGVEARHGLSKAEACRVLQVAPTADEELVVQAYWHHAGKLRVLAPSDPEARKRLDQLNRAYLVLNPTQTEAPLAQEVPPEQAPPPPGDPFFAEVGRWFRRAAEQTRRRWPNHVPEVTTLTATTALLTFLALSAGASPLWTLITAGVAAVAIWAPWRRL